MSTAQLADQQGLQDQAPQNAASGNDGSVEGLPPHLHAQVMAIRPGDARSLADLLAMFRDTSFAPAILTVAARTPHLGNALVQRAIKLSQQRTMQDIAPGSLGHGGGMDESVQDPPQAAAKDPAAPAPALGTATHKGGAFEVFGSDSPAPARGTAAPAPALGTATRQGGAFEVFGSDPAALAAAAAPTARSEPAWVPGARVYNTAHVELVSQFNELTSGMCLGDDDGKLDPCAVARWQAKHGLPADGKVGPHTIAAASAPKTHAPAEESAGMAHEQAHGLSPEEAPWKPSETKNETTLTGTYGEYKVKHGFTDDPDDGWEYEVSITMTASDKAKAEKIGWVQVVRRTKGPAGGWATGKDDQGMDEERAKRTDAKTGFRVDRASAPEKKTPFYGMDKGADGGLTAASNTVVGKHGGSNPYLWDAPGLNDKDELEFVSTATDMAAGTQYDAVRWGCKYDKANKVATETTPTLVVAGDALMAGRDRAISKWNSDVAGGDIDKVPTTADPVGTAKTLSGKLAAAKVDEAGVTTALKAVTDGDLRKRIQAAYKIETGKELAADLKAQVSKDGLTGLDAWL